MQESGMGAFALQPSQRWSQRRRVRRQAGDRALGQRVRVLPRQVPHVQQVHRARERLSPLHHCFSASGARPPARSVHAAPCTHALWPRASCWHDPARTSL